MRYKKKSATKKIAIIIIILCVFIILGKLYTDNRYEYLIKTPVNEGIIVNDELFTINKGENTIKTANRLYEKNLIFDKQAFIKYLKTNNLDTKIKTGRYAINPSMNIVQIAETITSGKQTEQIITIPEGFRIKDIDALLTKENMIDAGEFIKATKQFDSYDNYSFLNKSEQQNLAFPLEGYLFPDTYYVSANNFETQKLISQMLNNFNKKTQNLNNKSGYSLSEVIIVAAMIEKEANRDQDRPLIAGIIWKRLKENWILGIDATLLYLKDDNRITYQDLQADSPYNTRKFSGLPPGPICNPGIKSIEAAMNPKESEYYFYLTSKAGDMVYSKTNAEHNANKSKFL